MNSHKEGHLIKSVSGLKASMLSQAISTLLLFAKTYLFTLFVEPKHFGLIALSTTFTGLILILKEFGYTTYIIRQHEFRERELAFINSRVISLGMTAFLLTCLLSFPISKFFNQHELLWIVPLTGIQFVLNAFSIVPMALLKREMEFGKAGKVEIFSNVISILCGLILLLIIRNYWVLLLTTLLYFGCQLILSYKYARWKFQWTSPFNRSLSVHSNDFGLRLTLFNVITFISVNLDNLIIGKLAGNIALGVYSRSYDFGVLMMDKLRRPVTQVYFSSLSKQQETNRQETVIQFVFILVSVLLLFVGPVIICLDWIIENFLGGKWAEMQELMFPFLLSSFLWMTMSIADEMLVVAGNLKKYVALGLVKAGTGMIAIVAGSFWGSIGIAWSFFIYHLLLFLPFCYLAAKWSTENPNREWNLVGNLSFIVMSALSIVLIPKLLFIYHVISMPSALGLFLVLALMLYLLVWPSLYYFKSFKNFCRLLLLSTR